MTIQHKGKHKIDLSDYNFNRDIENRLLISQFSVFEVNVLNEIIHSSITISVKDLAQNMDVSVDKIIPVLDKLATTHLLKRKGDVIQVNKEMRKYYEFQIELLSEDFKPTLDFLQNLLNKIPIHILPTWYSIPRTSDNIFESIIEKYLITPKIYQQYLEELQLEDPVLQGIVEDVFNAPDYTIRSRTLREKYNLSREQFEEAMLFLEFNFVCCLHYTRVEDMWKEIVTPFHEWHEYLRKMKPSKPEEIKDVDAITEIRDIEFGFVNTMTAILLATKQSPLSLISNNDKLTDKEMQKLLSVARAHDLALSPTEISQAIRKLCMLKFAEVRDAELNSELHPLSEADTWLDLSVYDRAMYLHRHPQNRPLSKQVDPKLWTDRNIRLAEKSLKKQKKQKTQKNSGWTTFENFISKVIEPIGSTEEITLKKVGRRWKYRFPEYAEQERALIQAVIFERLYEIGIVAIGNYKGEPCFKLTSFGEVALGE